MRPFVSICLLPATIALAACSQDPSDEAADGVTVEETVADDTAPSAGEVPDNPAASIAEAIETSATGAMLYPDLPGASQSCLGVEGAIEVGVQVVLHDCNLPEDYLFAVDAKGKLSILGQPDLCLDLEGPGMGKQPVLIMDHCTSASATWTTAASAVESAPVSSGPADCLKVIEGEKFPFAIGIAPCAETAKVTDFFLEQP